MKIKTKKQLNLPQLIEWAWENDVRNKAYESKRSYIVQFDKLGFMQNTTLPIDEIFTVEVEEEITEYTVIPKVLTLYDGGDAYTGKNRSIEWFNKRGIVAIYLINDDYTMTLIWRDGKLVE